MDYETDDYLWNAVLQNYSSDFSREQKVDHSLIHPVQNLRLNDLRPYKSHPFTLYQGERLQNMVDSIKATGVIQPIIVRFIEICMDDNEEWRASYEILAGHNRVNASEVAGKETIPAIVLESLTDEDAHIIAIESNLIQRSFDEIPLSEKVTAIATLYAAIKKQGKRNDLIHKWDVLLSDNQKIDEAETYEKEQFTKSIAHLKSREVLAHKYGISESTITRYIKLNNLEFGLKHLLDTGALSMRAGCILAELDPVPHQYELATYLHDENAESTDDELILRSGISRVTVSQAEQLQKLDDQDVQDYDSLDTIFFPNRKIKKEHKFLSKKNVKVGFTSATLKNYFNEDDTETTIEETILTALAFYKTQVAK